MSCGDLTKMKKFYDNILIVGGGLANINGYDLILTDRLNIWRPRVLSTTSFESVIDYLKQLLNDAVSQAKQALPTSEETNQEVEIELSPDSLDLNHIDQLVNQGSILPDYDFTNTT